MNKGQATKARLIETTADLITRQGYHATGLNQITEESGTPMGSLYYHFKGGKDELVIAAMRANGDHIAHAMQQIFTHTNDVSTALRAITDFLADQLESSSYQKGCPIATVTLEEAAQNDVLQAAAQEIYQGWRHEIQTFLSRIGYAPQEAAAVAALTLSAIEGALIFSRAERNTAPLRQIATTLIALLKPITHS